MDRAQAEEWIRKTLKEGADLRLDLATSHATRIVEGAALLADRLRSGGKVLVFGNGGSAADAQHFAAELVGRFRRERDPLSAVALTTDTSALTAISNDYGIEHIFLRQVQALARRGDVVVPISTSGTSPNILMATHAARAAGLATLALTGGDGGRLANEVDVAIVVPSSDTARIQELHIAVIHLLCQLIETELFPPGSTSRRPIQRGASKIIEWPDLVSLRGLWRQEGKTVVWTNGVFDLLHFGHVHSLQEAKKFGEVLVVGVNTDDAVRKLKGPDRPVVGLGDRLRMLAALDATDYVVAFDDATPEKALVDLKPDVHVKGADYRQKPVPERSVVESYGGRVEFVPLLEGYSTTKIVDQVAHPGGKG